MPQAHARQLWIICLTCFALSLLGCTGRWVYDSGRYTSDRHHRHQYHAYDRDHGRYCDDRNRHRHRHDRKPTQAQAPPPPDRPRETHQAAPQPQRAQSQLQGQSQQKRQPQQGW